MKIAATKTNYQQSPIGISLENVTFSWKVKEAKGKRQTGVRIQIAETPEMEAPFFDSGEITYSDCTYVPKVQLLSGKAYYWTVAVTDDAGDTGISEPASFEGGHPTESWTGHWIKAPFVPELHPVFQKTFQANPTQLQARLYICGLGVYEVYINGRKVGDEYLTPYFTDYRYRIQYQTYDVGSYLQMGTNRIDVYLGNGWYKGKFGYLNKGELRNYYGSEFQLLADLYLKNGEEPAQIIGTDESWLALKSPVIVSGIYDGEMYDARLEKNILEVPARQKIYAVAAEAPKGELIPMCGLPVRKKEVLKVQQIITTDIQETVLDFGQEITGWVSFTADMPAGRKIKLRYAEVLQDGKFYQENLRTAKAEFEYISDGEKKRCRPHFTFYGFRYVLVTGMTVDSSNVDDFEAWALYSDMEETGVISTSNEKVNRLIENTKWSEKDNFLDIPTDCPQRDERLGWTGDAQIFSGAACFHMQPPVFFRKYMQDMKLEQEEKGGAVPYVVPDVLTLARLMNGEPEFHYEENLWGEAGASVWGDAATIIPWNLYLFYGDKTMLAEQYGNMKQWIDFIIGMDENYCGGKRLWNCGFHFGDWLSLDAEGDNREGGTDKYLVSSVYYMYSAQLAAKAAAILGKAEDALHYGKIAEEVRAAVRAAYVVDKGVLSVNTQTAYVLGIHFHIFEEEEMEIAAEKLKGLLEANGDKLLTGFVGTGYLCEALSQVGLADKAYTLLLNEEYPGWLYEVNLGATTIWERWNSLLPDGSISSTGMNSLNHYAYGAIAEWIYRNACGLQPLEDGAGFKKARFAPQTDDRLEYAQAQYESLNGTYRAGWKRTEKGMQYTLEIPFNCEAQVHLEKEYRKILVNGQETSRIQDTWLPCGNYEIAAE